MQIEQCFRDWKSHLGLRGLHLQVQKSERLLRVLMGFTLAYLMVLLLGTDPFAEKLRPYLNSSGVSLATEPARSSAYYPSLCRCSPIRVGSNEREKRMIEILARLAQGRGVALLPAFSP